MCDTLVQVVFLKTYTQYINAFDNSRGKLKALSEENEAFKALLDVCSRRL